MSTLLETHGLSKHFRDPWTFRRLPVLEDVELAVQEGEIFGLIGHNGAGKTTTFKLILGLLQPARGSIVFRGQPIDAAARAAIGFLPEQPYFYDYLSVEETLAFFARLYGLRGPERSARVADLMQQLHLTSKRRARMSTLSKGTLQRVGIAQALLGRPRLLILDEPMSGLDPAGRHHMRELLDGLRADGVTVIFSSHVLPDAEALCDRVGILAQGRLRDVVELHAPAEPRGYLVAVRRVTEETLATLRRLSGAAPAQEGNGWRVRLTGSEAVRAAVDAVHGAGGVVESLTPLRPSLEERFLDWVKDDGGLE